MEQTSDDLRRWLRVAVNLTLVGWFALIAFWLGPNLILFHKFTWMSVEDFVPVVQEQCVPVVRAIKMYQRTHGAMPTDVADLGPKFANKTGSGFHMIDSVRPYTYFAPGLYNHEISYDFTPGHEGWTVHGAFVNGPVPVPPVILEESPTSAP